MKLLAISKKQKDNEIIVQRLEGKYLCLMLYYADFCGHCTAMKPEWKKLAEMLKTDRRVHIMEVENDVIDYLPKKYHGVRGFPTIRLYKGGKVVEEYSGERTAKALVQFIGKHSAKKLA